MKKYFGKEDFAKFGSNTNRTTSKLDLLTSKKERFNAILSLLQVVSTVPNTVPQLQILPDQKLEATGK